jgi:DNA helicase-2/ATP-dependent DNA helicase PcrA
MTRAMQSLTMTHAQRRNIFGSTSYGAPSRFLAEIPDSVTDRQNAPGLLAAGAAASTRPKALSSWAQMRSESAAADSTAPPVAGHFVIGDEVRHAAFGPGVVTGVEAGGIVVVSFGRDAGERKLMAEYAPLTHI